MNSHVVIVFERSLSINFSLYSYNIPLTILALIVIKVSMLMNVYTVIELSEI